MKQETQTRLRNLRQLMQSDDCEALMIFSPANLRYLAGYSGEAAYALITQDQLHLITDYRFITQAEEECAGWLCYCRDREAETLGQVVQKLLLQSGVRQAAFEAAEVSVQIWAQIAQDSAGIQWTAAPLWTEQLRRRKDASELALIQRCAAIADQALVETLPLLRPGISEAEFALELDFRMRRLGAEALSFETITGFGERSALPHSIPSERRLRKGDLIVLDFGASVGGYRSDMTRTYIAGEPDARQQAMYNAVTQAQQAALAVIRDGISAREADLTARAVLAEHGFADRAGSSLGHGVGLRLHEQPIMTPKCEEILRSGYIVTIEPGVYLPGFGGVRLEDDVLITDHGYELLTHSPQPFRLT